ncbi:chorismate mutase family protein [Rhodococcus spongiicola]|uniref:Chorismate mutase n=1 Tax=Rhodococcus spongiicola TaxID=2487352 RepID=A0A3S3CUN7_9NOCA|nr:chorismate mutase [Rhodococcus spongiicola]RVW06034.1 chorismate mutase [Rhodococcus spongiicola]
MSVETDSLAVRATGSSGDVDETTLDRLEQEIAELDALILAAVRQRTDIARSLATVEAEEHDDAASRFEDLGSDGPALDRMLARLSAHDSE